MLKKEIEMNRLKIIPIVKTVIFCRRQGIALRGHRDSEMLLNDDENINTTSQMRLNGLAVFNIHQDINVNPSMIIDEMAKTSKRRLNINL
ncbi:Uncharacterized protein FWK35_00035692 [Aphis craccivora]|uniref:DUF4371 domain-containing protein n=1 Tax=Aphis craccivora TaxID=307492 RepID=A0A6G0Y7B5_APHCR|nr:Uncharacterized protein FWK35_00035692 [Aphis craccivora]